MMEHFKVGIARRAIRLGFKVLRDIYICLGGAMCVAGYVDRFRHFKRHADRTACYPYLESGHRAVMPMQLIL